MILIFLFLIFVYFIIKFNNNKLLEFEKINPTIENFKNNIEQSSKKQVRFSEKIDYYENNSILPPLKHEINNNSNLPSFYSSTWYGNYYLEDSKNKNLKRFYNENDNYQLNPKPEDEKKFNPDINVDKIKDIYDNNTNNYKDFEKKKLVNYQDKILDGASNLSYYIPDTWIYENENIINGGNISYGLTGYDEMALNNTALY
jgi:hypothetical protein